MSPLALYINNLIKAVAQQANQAITLAERKTTSLKKKDVQAYENLNKEEISFVDTLLTDLHSFNSNSERIADVIAHYSHRNTRQTDLLHLASRTFANLQSPLIHYRELLQRPGTTLDQARKYHKQQEKLLDKVQQELVPLLKQGANATSPHQKKSWKRTRKLPAMARSLACIILILTTLNIPEMVKAEHMGEALQSMQETHLTMQIGHDKVHMSKESLPKHTQHALAAQQTYEECAATIYAQSFDGRPTANGSIFRHNKMSCAVPLGSKLLVRKGEPVIVRITNLDNGKAITVPVTDVGNFGFNEKKGRYNKYKNLTIDSKTLPRGVDLSRQAACELGIISQEAANTKKDINKSARVKIEVVSGTYEVRTNQMSG